MRSIFQEPPQATDRQQACIDRSHLVACSGLRCKEVATAPHKEIVGVSRKGYVNTGRFEPKGRVRLSHRQKVSTNLSCVASQCSTGPPQIDAGLLPLRPSLEMHLSRIGLHLIASVAAEGHLYDQAVHG